MTIPTWFDPNFLHRLDPGAPPEWSAQCQTACKQPNNQLHCLFVVLANQLVHAVHRQADGQIVAHVHHNIVIGDVLNLNSFDDMPALVFAATALSSVMSSALVFVRSVKASHGRLANPANA